MLKNGKTLLSIFLFLCSTQGLAGSLESYYAGDFRKALSQYKTEIHREQYPRLMLEQKLRFAMDLCAHAPELTLSLVEGVLGEARSQEGSSQLKPSLEQRIQAVHELSRKPSLTLKAANDLLDAASDSGNQAMLMALSLYLEWQTRKSEPESDWIFLLGKTKSHLGQGGRFYLEKYMRNPTTKDPGRLKEAYQLIFDEVSLDSPRGLSRDDERLLARLKEAIRR